ncbi:Rhodanese-like domain-containing protein [Xylariales sp. AK1849]|nr:Rhodanese-like domain-containing protein [Xylariales sp. AK1849]
MDYEDVRDHILPHFLPEGENDTLPRILQTTFLNVLDGEFGEIYTHRIVIDSRFEYEYKGGHIDGAINYNDKELLARHLFETPIEGKVLLIFHCEYSSHRAPMMACHIRSRDRSLNADFYPRLTYPDIYILDGGYREFFMEHRDRCYLQSYVKMNDQRHAATCEREMGKLRQKRRTARRADNRFALKDVNPWPKHEPA